MSKIDERKAFKNLKANLNWLLGKLKRDGLSISTQEHLTENGFFSVNHYFKTILAISNIVNYEMAEVCNNDESSIECAQ